MSEHYYTHNPHSEQDEQKIEVYVNGETFNFVTDHGVFSKDRLDYGSKVLIETFSQEVELQADDRLLELGSGYGPIVLSLAHYYGHGYFVGVELNQRAFQLAMKNTSNQLVDSIQWLNEDVTQLALPTAFNYVLTNPPIRAGKAVIQQFVDQAFIHLKIGGSFWAVIQKKQGAPSYRKYMQKTFGNCRRIALNKGYWVLMSQKTEEESE